MYIETSAPVKPGDKARLTSPGLNGAAQFCITFWYHMYGPHINALNVYLAQNTTLGTPVWRRSGTQGNKWNKGTFTIQGGSATAAVTNVGLITIVMILSFQTNKPWQTVQTETRLLLEEQSDQGLHCYSICIFWRHFSAVRPLC